MTHLQAQASAGTHSAACVCYFSDCYNIIPVSTGSKRVDVYHAIADANRRRLLELLHQHEHSVQQLMPHFDVTVGAVSQHLKILLENKLVSRRKRGRFRFYRATPAALKEVYEWTEQYRRFWGSRLDRLGEYLDDSE